ncbi:MAG: DUF3175 domain-containing protein [Rhodospirillaceae bacterium]|nr:DUF3175 domain-containing protein [Rhodospirillaceae bacterium]
MPTPKKRRAPARANGGAKRWSGRVNRESDALDLDRGVFAGDSPKRIAASLKRSAERSKRRKSSPYRSAMSMLTFYINRAGKNLSRRRLGILERAKDELRAVFGRG